MARDALRLLRNRCAVVVELCAQAYPVHDADAARMSAFTCRHVRLDEHYSFYLPDLGGGHRPRRDPGTPADD